MTTDTNAGPVLPTPDGEARTAFGVRSVYLRQTMISYAHQFAEQVAGPLRERIAELEGIKPELPPRPPDGDGLPRYGLRWNGPTSPLSVPMADGYWTPWHLAAERIAELEQEVEHGGERHNGTWVAMLAECQARGSEIDRLRAENEALRSGIEKAIGEIEDASPKALKYAEQELRKAIDAARAAREG